MNSNVINNSHSSRARSRSPLKIVKDKQPVYQDKPKKGKKKQKSLPQEDSPTTVVDQTSLEQIQQNVQAIIEEEEVYEEAVEQFSPVQEAPQEVAPQETVQELSQPTIDQFDQKETVVEQLTLESLQLEPTNDANNDDPNLISLPPFPFTPTKKIPASPSVKFITSKLKNLPSPVPQLLDQYLFNNSLQLLQLIKDNSEALQQVKQQVEKHVIQRLPTLVQEKIFETLQLIPQDLVQTSQDYLVSLRQELA